MRRFSLYIMGQLIGPLIVVAFSFTCVIWLTQSLRFIDLIINKGLSFGLFLYMTALLLPSLLSVILPIALFAAVLYTYHQLIVDREIIVLKAIGLSNARLALPALGIASISGTEFVCISFAEGGGIQHTHRWFDHICS